MRALSALAVLFTGAICSAQTPYEIAQKTLRSAPLESVLEPEVFAPKPPTLFAADGRTFLCYELLITNMENTPFRVERIDVYEEGASPVLYEQDRTELSAVS